MGKLKTFASGLVIAAVLVVCTDYVAFATTGDSLLLGKVNHAGAVTTIDRTTNGPALKLHTNNAGSAPIVTNGHGMVANLNADQVDGRHASYFAPKAHAPIAAGYLDGNGTQVAGFGVSAATWNDANDRYEITVTGQSFALFSYAVTVSPTCGGYTGTYGSVGGKLTVHIYDTSNALAQCGFAFTVIKL